MLCRLQSSEMMEPSRTCLNLSGYKWVRHKLCLRVIVMNSMRSLEQKESLRLARQSESSRHRFWHDVIVLEIEAG